MNPAVIEPPRGKSSGTLVPCLSAICANDFYNHILNIAGIGTGDTVACLDGECAFVQEALSARGACIRSISTTLYDSRERKSRRKNDARTDAVLWAANGFSQVDPVRTLEIVENNLRPGGRLVLWIPSDGFHGHQIRPERIDSLLISAGFVCVIVGRLPLNGQDAVVATGVLGKKAKR